MSQKYNRLRELHTNLTKCYFSWKHIFPLLLYLGMLGLRWLCLPLWLNLVDWTIDIQERKKKLKFVNIYVHMYIVQSQWRVVLLWYQRFWQSSVQRGQHTKLCILVLLNGLSKFVQNFTVGRLKLFSTHPIRIVVWGNFPFNSGSDASASKTSKWNSKILQWPSINANFNT